MPFSTLLLSVATSRDGRRWRSPSPLRHRRKSSTRINTTRTRITRTPAIATTPTITQVVRSLFMRNNRRQCRAQGYAWGPVAAVGNVVGGTGQAVQGVFTGAGAVVGGVLGGVFGGVSALFGYPPSYAYGASFAAPFNATGAVAAAPFQSVSGALGAPPPAQAGY